jgi:ABC-type phosphate transport system substrate-binding protein
MYRCKKNCRRWFVALLSLTLSCTLVSKVAVAQPNPGFGICPLSVPAKAGAVVVRANWRSEFLPSIEAIARAFPARDKLDINYDDYASFGRFCDDDNPFHVVIEEGSQTSHDQWCLQRRFPAGTPQPEAFLLGHFRVILVVNKDNPIRLLDFAEIRKAFNQAGKTSKWEDVGGAGTAAIRCYGPPEKTWVRQLVQDKCMSRWHDVDTPGVRELQRLEYRKDLVACADAKEVIAKVRKNRYGLGFFAIGEALTERDLQGVRVLRIAAKEGDQPIAPSLEAVVEGSYPLAEPVFLYVHPSAPKEAWEFCKFATGPEAAKIVKQCGLWPEYDLEQICGKQRLAELRRGKGATIKVCDLAGRDRLLNDLAAKFVKAKSAVRLCIQKGEGRGAGDEGFATLFKEGSDLVLADKSSGQSNVQSPIASPPAEKGTVPGTLRGEGQSPFPRSIVLGRMVVGVVVHPKNILNSLPLDELRGILCKEITQWPAANGVAGTMHVFGLQHTDPMTHLLKERVGRVASGQWSVASEETGVSSFPIPNPQSPIPLKYNVESDTAKVVFEVAKDPFAIGFVDLSKLPPDEKSVKRVNVYLAGQAAKKSVKDATGPLDDYPLARTFTLYISPNASQTAKDFAEFATSAHCAETLAQHNLIPPLHASPVGANRETTARSLPKTSKHYLGNRR